MDLKKYIAIVLSAVFILFAANPALACACCVNRGYYEHTRDRLDAHYTGILSSIKTGRSAELYLSEGGFDVIKGLPELARDEAAGKDTGMYTTWIFARKMWTINVTTGAGRSGTLLLPVPAMFTKHKVDTDGVDTGLGVSLYKEFTVSGRVTGATGIFRSANNAARYTLMFQGRGNGCDDSADFTRWRLELDGPRAQYAFFGTAGQ